MSSSNHENKVRADDSIRIAREYMDSLLVESRIVGSVYPSTQMRMFGETFETPIMTAALSHLRTISNIAGNPLADMASGAKQAGAMASIGMGDNDELLSVLNTGAKTMKIIKPYMDEKEILSRIEFCEEHGALAVGMDVEHAVNVADAENSVVLGIQMKQPTLADLKRYINHTKLPFVIKGALSLQDVKRCIDLGCKGVILSHHNGLMRWAVPPVMLLPKIRKEIRDEIAIIVDGGMESGYDVFKALALGADAVTVGRPLIPVLKEKGPQGVYEKITAMNNELKAMMIRTDSPDIMHIDPTVIWHK